MTTTDTQNSRVAGPPGAEARPRMSSSYHYRVVDGAMILGAALVAGSGAFHLHLWMSGYRYIHIVGPLFIAQALSAFVVALAVAAWRSVTTALAGMALLAGTSGGLLLSSWHGIFGFHESLSAPYAGLSLFAEGTGLFVLALAAASRHRLRRSGCKAGLASTGVLAAD